MVNRTLPVSTRDLRLLAGLDVREDRAGIRARVACDREHDRVDAAIIHPCRPRIHRLQLVDESLSMAIGEEVWPDHDGLEPERREGGLDALRVLAQELVLEPHIELGAELAGLGVDAVVGLVVDTLRDSSAVLTLLGFLSLDATGSRHCLN